MAQRADLLAELNVTLSGLGPTYEYVGSWMDSASIESIVIACSMTGADPILWFDESADQSDLILSTEIGPHPYTMYANPACRYFRIRATSTTSGATLRASLRIAA